MAKIKMHVLVCGGTGCQASASAQIIKNFEDVLAAKGLQDEVQVVRTGCFGFCEKARITSFRTATSCTSCSTCSLVISSAVEKSP